MRDLERAPSRLRAAAAVLLTCLLLPASIADAATSTTLSSGAAWTVYSADPGTAPDPSGPTAVGPAQPVCLNDSVPSRCPAGAVRWEHDRDGWGADLSGIPDAVWIWAPGLSGSSEPSEAAFFFSTTVSLAAPPFDGRLAIAADNFAQLRVNGTIAGTIGSVTDPAVAHAADDELTTLSFGSLLRAGANVITIEARNGVAGECPAPCPYSADPAGVVFGGVVTDSDPAPRATTTSVASSEGRPVHGQRVTLTAIVADAAAGGSVPTGLVQFFLDGSAVGDARGLEGDGRATVTTASLTAGDHVVRADYRPSGSFAASQGETRIAVGKADTVTTITTKPAAAVAGQGVAASVSVRAKSPGAGTPAGTIQLSAGGNPIGGPERLSADGTVTVDLVGPAGSHRLQATYGGDRDFAQSSGDVGIDVARADTVTVITSTPNPVASGASFVVDVTVSIVPPGDVGAFGTVQLTIDGAPLGPAFPLEGNDGVRLTLRPTGPGRTETIGATYSGDDDTNPSAAALSQTVTAPAVQPPTAGGGAPPQRSGAVGSARRVRPALLADMTTALVSALRRRGLAALSGTVETLQAPEPGRLEQRVLAVGAKGSRVLVASARHTFATGGLGSLRLRLTAAGQRLTRRAKVLRLRIETRFTPRGRAAVTVVRRITVRARGTRAARVERSSVRVIPRKAPARSGRLVLAAGM